MLLRIDTQDAELIRHFANRYAERLPHLSLEERMEMARRSLGWVVPEMDDRILPAVIRHQVIA